LTEDSASLLCHDGGDEHATKITVMGGKSTQPWRVSRTMTPKV